jgi:glyoxylase-like metal-dependent hydrolase (beta-lactamase superfamily II)
MTNPRREDKKQISNHSHMHFIKHHSFGRVQAYELGFSPVGRTLKTVYIYIIDNVLVDTGQHHMHRYVNQIADDNPISTVLLTHHHEDHSGNAGMLKKKLNVPVHAHPLAAKKLKDGFRIMPYQHILFGKADKIEISPYPEIITTGSLRFKPIHTPGHSKDHTVYLEENNGWLFSGDLFLAEKIQFFRVDERIEDQIMSLTKTLLLDFDALFCGHHPVIEKGKEKIAAKLQFLQSFRGQVDVLLQKGDSEKEIIRKLQFKSDLPVKLFTMGNASFTNMVRSSVNEFHSGK